MSALRTSLKVGSILTFIKQYIKDWKAATETPQMDDVLVIGIEL
jgi:hypothetical protein